MNSGKNIHGRPIQIGSNMTNAQERHGGAMTERLEMPHNPAVLPEAAASAPLRQRPSSPRRKPPR
jgi:hypothetical protein